MTNTDINYLPNQTTFTDCRADVKFKNDDVYLQNVVIHKNEDVIKMDGYAKQFLNFYFNDPSKAAIQWTINADALHLQNYLSFFNRSYTSNNTATTTAKNVQRFSQNLSNFAKQSSMHIDLAVKKILYKKFVSSSVRADLSLLEIYNLSNGYLKNFEPLKKIERFILRARNLSNLEIRNLEGTFTLDNGKIRIPLTEVGTSALNIFMQGVYGVENGTNIKLLIPLRNPKKDEIKAAKGMEIDKQRGLKLYLQGIDNQNGKVEFSWLPRKDRPAFSQ